MYHASKVRGEDLTPNFQDSLHFVPAIFFVAIVIFGNFFLINLFIGVIISKYNREKELAGKDYMLTEDQKKWVKNRMNIISAQPKYKMEMPQEGWRQPLFFISESVYVQVFVSFCIIANTVVLSL